MEKSLPKIHNLLLNIKFTLYWVILSNLGLSYDLMGLISLASILGGLLFCSLFISAKSNSVLNSSKIFWCAELSYSYIKSNETCLASFQQSNPTKNKKRMKELNSDLLFQILHCYRSIYFIFSSKLIKLKCH